MIDEYNHSRIFISEKYRYYIRCDNKSIYLQILNEFKDIRKSYNKIDVIDTNNNYYKIDKSRIIKNCTILLIDDDNRSKIFISEKKLYYTSNDCDYFGVDVDDYELYDENYKFFDEDYEDYDYYDDDYDDDCYKEVNDDYDDDDYDFYDKLYYEKLLNYFERLVSVKNNIENVTSNDDYTQNITLVVTSHKILIC